MDVEEIISGLEDLDRAQLARVEAALSHRRQTLRVAAPIGEADADRPVSGVVEYLPHADGTLQKEVRRYYRKDGTPKEQGPYWYFRYHEGGSRRSSTWARPTTRRVLWPPSERNLRGSRLVNGVALHTEEDAPPWGVFHIRRFCAVARL